jgi:hypothetical protein
MAAGFAGRRPAHGNRLSGLSFFHWKAHWVGTENDTSTLWGLRQHAATRIFLRVFGMPEKILGIRVDTSARCRLVLRHGNQDGWQPTQEFSQ